MAVPQAVTAPSVATPSAPLSQPSTVPERVVFHILERCHLDDFSEELKKTVLSELAPAFPELQTVLNDGEYPSSEPRYQRVVLQLLEAAKNVPADRRLIILFAADLVAEKISCAIENKAECEQLRLDFARYQLTLTRAELGGVFVYPQDLLWRIWKEYPETEWGERAFVLLLDRGWDTSGICEKGEDQTREVIHQGESFLRQRPSSPYPRDVPILVAESYASRWSLSNEPAGSQ